MRALLCASALLGLAVLPGCACVSSDGFEPTPDPPAPNEPPHVTAIDIPAWPPVGPKTSIRIEASDDQGLFSMDVTFREHLTFALKGTENAVTVRGNQLGEGLGTLFIDVQDLQGRGSTRTVSELLVDLSPPEIAIGKAVLKPTDELELWVSDAWVLGSVSLSAGGKTLTHTFPEGYPETLGETWDSSLVKFPAADLLAGSALASIVVTDAAGNARTQAFPLTIDPTPPQVTSLTTSAASPITGDFDIDIDASDAEGGPVTIEISVGGAPVATAVGPSAIVKLNANDFAAGPTVVSAVAMDEAGNVSAEVTLDVVLQ